MKGIGVVGEELSQTSKSIWKTEHYDVLPSSKGKTPWHGDLKLLQARSVLLATSPFVIHLIALIRRPQLLPLPHKALPDIVPTPIHIMGRQMP